MRSDYGYAEDDHLGKPYDLRLLKRLTPYLRPYRAFLVGSTLLVVAITLLDLAMPYFTKVAIDRYIVPTEARTGSSTDRPKEARRQRYLVVDLTDARLASVVARHPRIFERQGTQARIAIEDLKRLPRYDLVILRQKDMAGLTWVVLLFLAVVAADFLLTFLQRVIMEYAGHRVMHDLRMQLYDHIQLQSMAFFTHQPVARLVTRVTNDVQNMHELFTTFITMVFKDIFVLLGIAVVLWILDWRLALAGFSVLPLVIWAAAHFSSRMRDVFRALRGKVAEINTRMAETIEGIRTIQTFGQEAANYNRFARLNHDTYRLGVQEIHIFALFMPLIEVLGIVAVAILILYGGLHVLSARISLGALVAAISYLRMFFRPLRDLAENYNVLQNAMASAERIFGLLDTEQRLPVVAHAASESSPDWMNLGELELHQVSFGYLPGELVVQQVSFAVHPGQTIALVGPTGAGKTSVLSLIMRFYDPTAGRVSLNGKDLRQWDPGRLRSLMALVPQDPVLFTGTLRQNIFPQPETISEASVARIIAAANCEALVQRLPQGLDTPLVKGGANLSSGERQLITIARALARHPQLILLDEATSYIDSQTEAAFQSALRHLMEGRTCVIVAHRLSTARSADRIVVMHNGRVVQSGPHTELMDCEGLYRRLNEQSANPIHV